jgi:hypothetical protein
VGSFVCKGTKKTRYKQARRRESLENHGNNTITEAEKYSKVSIARINKK